MDPEKQNHKFLFILSPAFSGSTLIAKLIGTSKNASIFSNQKAEGQEISELRDIMNVHDKWDETKKLPWSHIKNVFKKNWDLNKPILVEKSPPNIIRAKEIESEFNNPFFIVSIRNPYAWCYSHYRREGRKNISRIVRRWIYLAKFQIKNIENLKNVLFFSYEDLTTFPKKTLLKISKFIPELNDIDINQEFAIHSLIGDKKKQIMNFNNLAISNFSHYDIDQISEILKKEKDILNYFSYTLIKTSKMQ